MPTVTKRVEKIKNTSLRCPITGCNMYIHRTRGSWMYHMKTYHNVVEDELGYTVYGGTTEGLTDIDIPRLRYGNLCYDCGSYFTSKDDLISHLQTGKIVDENVEVNIITEDGYRLIQE